MDGVKNTGGIEKHDPRSACWLIKVCVYTDEQVDDGVVHFQEELALFLSNICIAWTLFKWKRLEPDASHF